MRKTPTLLVALAALAAALLQGCAKQQNTTTASAAPSEETPRLQKISEETQHYLAGKHICLLLAHGYNDEAFVAKTRALLEHDYGVADGSKDGLILLYVYPDDFYVGEKPRVSKLASLLEDTALAGLIVLGAPEGLSIPLAKLQDASGDSLPYPVFSLFPQDDVLAAQADADFVLDYAYHNDAESEATKEETEATQDFDADQLITNSIQAMLNLRAPLKQRASSQELLQFVQSIVGKQRTIVHYTDIESGIQSANHFIFQ